MVSPKMLTELFQPGLGVEHEVGLTGVGVCVVTATLACNTARTAAELIADPSNLVGAATCGPVIHSLGTPPSLTFVTQVSDKDEAAGIKGGSMVHFAYCTADNSAVYVFARSNTADSAAPVGVGARFVMVR